MLFASADAADKECDKGNNGKPADQTIVASSISLPRSYLLVLTFAAAAISMTLGILSASWIQASAAPWIKQKIRARGHAQLQTVLASTKAPTSIATPAVETASLEQLKQMADTGDANAQNALGLHYATGEGVALNEKEAVRWFIKAAEQGNVLAQSKLGSIFTVAAAYRQTPTAPTSGW